MKNIELVILMLLMNIAFYCCIYLARDDKDNIKDLIIFSVILNLIVFFTYFILC